MRSVGDLICYVILLEGMIKSRWSVFKTIDEAFCAKEFNYICNYCNRPGLPSLFVLVTRGVKLEGDVKTGLCTTCANKMGTDKKYKVVGNEISRKETRPFPSSDLCECGNIKTYNSIFCNDCAQRREDKCQD